MRLIVVYEVSDGCTFTCTNTIPIEYESGEKFLCDLDDHVKNGVENWPDQGFRVSGTDFFKHEFISDGIFSAPQVFTVDEWFKYHSV